jgi:Putative RNA methyltransferase
MEVTESTDEQRNQRKEEGKLQKKQRIFESGGTRPRSAASNDRPGKVRRTVPSEIAHRFGRVMEQAPCRNVPRLSTVSIAIPGSIVTNCQTKELQTILCGQIARMATIYHVDEIIVYDDQLSHTRPQSFNRSRNRPPRNPENDSHPNQEESHHSTTDPQVFMGRILQYCECPQYLRRHFFPLHADLQYTGILPPMDAPHHVRAQDRSVYREGVVLSQLPPTSGSLVNCGIRNRPVQYVLS